MQFAYAEGLNMGEDVKKTLFNTVNQSFDDLIG